jgi:hypothetical protein
MRFPMVELFPVEVECYAGQRAGEEPRRFRLEGRTVEIVEIIDRWYDGGADPRRPLADYYKVRGDDGEVRLLRYSRKAEAWYLVKMP